jgi:tetratricopeptide (TPR) repeat protein
VKKFPPVAGSVDASRSAALRRLARGRGLWLRRRASRCGRIDRPARSGNSFTTSERVRCAWTLATLVALVLGCGGATGPRSGSIYERAGVLEQSSVNAALRGDLAHAAAFQGQAVNVYRSVDDTAAAAASLNRLGNLRQRLGDLVAARRAYAEALVLSRRANERAEEAAAESNLGTVLEESGDAAGARAHYERARAIAVEVEAPAIEAAALNNLALLAGGQGNDTEARKLLEAAIELDRASGEAAGLAVRLRNLGALELRAGRLDVATRALEEAHALDREREDMLGIALDLVALSEVRARAGDAMGAVSDRRRALEIHSLLGLDADVRADRAALDQWCGPLEDVLDCELLKVVRSPGG